MGTDHELKSLKLVKKDDKNKFVFSEYQNIFRHSLRLKFSLEKNNCEIISEYYYQPNVTNIRDNIIYGTTKISFFPKNKLNFTIGDLWMLAAAIGWALYSIYLFYWKTNLPIFQRFTLIAFFGVVSLFPFYITEELIFQRTSFNSDFFFCKAVI